MVIRIIVSRNTEGYLPRAIARCAVTDLRADAHAFDARELCLIEVLRRKSGAEKKRTASAMMDVNAGSIEALLREHGYPRLIHGHTHRPARHEHLVDGHRYERWVLADWYTGGSYLSCDTSSVVSIAL